MKEDGKMVVKRRFERINNIAYKSSIKYEDIPENKEIFIYGLKHNETDIIPYYILVGCESDVFYENIKLFNFWSVKFTYKEAVNK